ncbi:MAG: RecQ family ATP-dependent DNA helicase [Bacilli bacterium]|nr:RecQ family ATP-dependent DNA helicase [Bacilli bacterium]
MKPIIFIDTEVSTESKKLEDFGSINSKGIEYHGLNKLKILHAFKGFSFICGHNILNHDINYIKNYINPKKVDIIDTLCLSPLIYPKKLYHKLLKDDKIFTEEINNPLNDAKKCRDLFYCELEAFNSFPNSLKSIFGNLLSKQNEFAGFFKYVDYSLTWNLKKDIFNFFKGKICENANLSELIDEYPVELGYALSLINTSDKEDNIAPWVLINYPKIEYVIKMLRSTPCKNGCSYCNTVFDLKAKLKQFFNYDEFRMFNGEKLQENAVRGAAYGESLLAIFPTGGGKSLTFQLPALIDGEASRSLTVVISPLQSLMKDQVDGLEKKGLIDAVTINGLLDPIQRSEAINRVMSGKASILYISPELLRSKTIEKMLLARNISRFVIDEAHCFSTWGQDFRVDYLFIANFIKYIQEKKNLSKPIPVSCFTATAKQKVISDICQYFKENLNIDLKIYATTATRTNLHYRVELKRDDDEKYISLRELIRTKKCSTIVYVSRTRTTELIAEKLSLDGIKALPFNGKMDSQDKIRNQEKFINNEVQVMVATSAFGMGVDKSDVKLVVHYEISDSLENYVQEAGRAGRNENIQAECIVYFNEDDLNKHFQLLNKSKLSIKDISQIWKGIRNLTAKKRRNNISCSALEIAREAGWDDSGSDVETRVRTAISALESSGYIERGFNTPKIFATSLNVRSVIEARNRIESSELFDSEEVENAVRIISKLIGIKNRHSPGVDLESRVDVISDDLGIEKSVVITLIDKMRSIKLLYDNNDMHGHFRQDSINKTDNLLDLSLKCEWFLFGFLEKYLNHGKNSLNLKEMNDEAIKGGIKKATVEKFKKIINYWRKHDYLEKECKIVGYNYEIILKDSLESINKKLSKRSEIIRFVVDYLFDKALKNKSEYLEFSINELIDCFNNRNSLFANDMRCTISEMQKTLLYLSDMGILSIDGGFLVLYNTMQITKIKENKKKYTKDDYRQLEEHYNMKIQQIHIVGEYANMMLKDYNEALTYVSDYFNMQYDGFIKKYFKGNRFGEIKRNITADRYNRLFGSLSPKQKEIIDDDKNDFITVLAGPGSGKTRVLVHKMASLLLLEDVKSEQLLMLTFSRSAATEFKSRLIDLIGDAAHYVEIKTFHSYCFDLLGKLGKKTTDDELGNIIDEAIEMIEDNSVEQCKIAKTVIVIDEAQDISEKEYRLILAIIKRSDDIKIIAVGDDDQNIYEFRDSNSKYMKLICDSQESSAIYELVDNYRSVNEIVSFSNKFVRCIKNRMKTNEIKSVREEKGIVGLAKYESPNIEELVVDSVAKKKINSDKVAILTRTNEESLKVLSLLNKKEIKAKLIQSNDGINLFNLQEIRYFYDYINKDDNPIVSDELWMEGVSEMTKKFMNSSSLEITMTLLTKFKKVNKTKYKTDLKEFAYESDIEDFIETDNCNYVVSTLHKAKGREFDTVHLLLNNISMKTNEEKRLLYVGMTRAKQNLIIHYNNNIFDSYKNGVIFKENKRICDEPQEIILQLGYRDVNLGYFKNQNVQNTLANSISGDPLFLNDEYLLIKSKRIARFSARFICKLKELDAKGYKIIASEIRHIVYWKDNEDMNSDKEYLVILPTIYMSKKFDDASSSIIDNNLTDVEGESDKKELNDYDINLFLELKKLRNKIAFSEGVAMFQIFSNETILEMSMRKPEDHEQFLSIKGIGKYKTEKYADIFIKAINKYLKRGN